MVDELHPERLRLRGVLRDRVLPWIVEKACDTQEISLGVGHSDLTRDALIEDLSRADHLVTTTGPEYDAVYRLALGKDSACTSRSSAPSMAFIPISKGSALPDATLTDG